jgi:hypothetical protein
MRTAIIEGEDAAAIVDDEDRMAGAAQDEPPFSFSSSRLPASAKSVFGASMRMPPLGRRFRPLQVPRSALNISALPRKRERAGVKSGLARR